MTAARIDEILAQQEALRAFALDMAHGDDDLADELLQQTLIQSWLQTSHDIDSTRAYSRKVLQNQAIRENRTQRREARRGAVALEQRRRDLLEQEDREGVREIVRAVVQTLDEPYRTTILEFYMSGFSREDVAQKTGVSAEAVKARLTKARSMLRGRLATALSAEGYAGFGALLLLAGLLPEQAAAALASAQAAGSVQAAGAAQAAGTVAAGKATSASVSGWIGLAGVASIVLAIFLVVREPKDDRDSLGLDSAAAATAPVASADPAGTDALGSEASEASTRAVTSTGSSEGAAPSAEALSDPSGGGTDGTAESPETRIAQLLEAFRIATAREEHGVSGAIERALEELDEAVTHGNELVILQERLRMAIAACSPAGQDRAAEFALHWDTLRAPLESDYTMTLLFAALSQYSIDGRPELFKRVHAIMSEREARRIDEREREDLALVDTLLGASAIERLKALDVLQAEELAQPLVRDAIERVAGPDYDAQTRAAALYAMSRAIDERLIVQARAFVLDASEAPRVRAAAARVLSRAAQEGADDIRATLAGLLTSDDDPTIRRFSVSGLNRPPTDATIVDALIRASTDDPDAGVRSNAVGAMRWHARNSDEIVEHLRRLAEDESQDPAIGETARSILEHLP